MFGDSGVPELLILQSQRARYQGPSMSTHRFRTGDRVKTRKQILDVPAGAVGTVTMVYNTGQDVYIVRFDKYPGPRMIWGTDLEMAAPITLDGSAT